MSGDRGARGIATWDETLAHALQVVDEVPAGHNLHTVEFGTFADSVGGGHYVRAQVSYELGNTVAASRPDDPAAERRRRIIVVAAAWSRAMTAALSTQRALLAAEAGS